MGENTHQGRSSPWPAEYKAGFGQLPRGFYLAWIVYE